MTQQSNNIQIFCKIRSYTKFRLDLCHVNNIANNSMWPLWAQKKILPK